MHKVSRLRALVLGLFALTTLHVSAGQDSNLEDGLANALRLKSGSAQRTGTSGKAIQAYMHAGLIGKKPTQRIDYTDYYLLRKPAGFMGHELVVIEEEYMAQYVGCCVSPGAGLSVKVKGRTDNLEAFARQNKCTFTDKVDLQRTLREASVKVALPAARYATLSCRERDAER
jgi:hypothetical protein